MKKFTGLGGYEFYLDDTWEELTQQERAKFNVNPRVLNYLVNYTSGKEFLINPDGYAPNNDDLERFFNLCKNTMIKYNIEIINEEKFVGISLISGEKMEAYKLMSRMPNGILQTSYFMRLTGETPRGYLYGCLTATVEDNHDENEAVLIETITNWKYIDNLN